MEALLMERKSFKQLVSAVQSKTPQKVAIAAASDEHTIDAALIALKRNIAIPVFIGNQNKITELLNKLGEDASDYEIVHEEDALRTPYIACNLVNAGKVSFVMKGFIDTSDFLRGILNKENGLRTNNIMSHIAVLEIPTYHKLLGITDGGMVTNPDLAQKRQIIENSVTVFKNMGYKLPKVGAVTAVEKPNKAMPETLEAKELQDLCSAGIIKDCVVEGPISYDIAISKESATLKNFFSPNCGNYDILLMPNISTANITSKALIYNAGAKMAGIVVGAKVSLVLNSRSSSAEEKFYAMVLAAASSL
jgi:phosphate butyryltransferase